METNKINNGCKSQNNNKIKNETELLEMFTAGDDVRAFTYVPFFHFSILSTMKFGQPKVM